METKMMNSRDWDRREDDYGDIIYDVMPEGKDSYILKYGVLTQNWHKTIGDMGCGRGPLLEHIKCFKKVIAVDYSEKLLNVAKEKYGENENISFHCMDMRSMPELHNTLDVAVSAGSIIGPTITDCKEIFKEIYNCLRGGGVFYGILASYDTCLYYARLQIDKYMQEGKTEKEAVEIVSNEMKDRTVNPIAGYYKHDGFQVKYFYEYEIVPMLTEAGFKDIFFCKNYYSWENSKKYDYGFFPGKEKIWDWNIVAKK